MEKALYRLRIISKKLLTVFLILPVFLNLTWAPNSATGKQAEITSTTNPDTTVTGLPTETPPVQATETPLPTFTETPTLTISPVPTELTADTSSVNDQSLSGDFVSDEVLIRFRKRASSESIDQCVEKVHATIESEIEELTTFVLKVQTGKIAETIFNLQACSDILYAEPNYLAFVADTIPSDPDWNLQYGLVNIRAPQGWDYSTGSTAVTIAIIDSGVDLSHADLAGKIVPG